jgi:hypothetical protein
MALRRLSAEHGMLMTEPQVRTTVSFGQRAGRGYSYSLSDGDHSSVMIENENKIEDEISITFTRQVTEARDSHRHKDR